MFIPMTRQFTRRPIVPAVALLLSVTAGAAMAQGSAAAPTIGGVEKSLYCAYGDLLVLDGTGFGLRGARSYVTVTVPIVGAGGTPSFQDFPLSIRDWTDTEIQARLFLPTGAQPGVWIATVHRDDGAAAAHSFTTALCPPVLESSTGSGGEPPPVIVAFLKTEVHAGDPIVIEGENFGLNQNGGVVTLIGAFQDSAGLYYREFETSVESWSDTRIQAALIQPVGWVPGTWVVTVHRSDGETASHEFLVAATPLPPSNPSVPSSTPTPPPPTMEDCLEAGDPVVYDFQKLTFCAEGDFIVLHGEHFCNDPDGGWVTITAPFKDSAGNIYYQELPASVTAWLSNQIQIQFKAPPGAVPGTYTATVHVYRDDGAGNSVLKTASGSFNVVSCSQPSP